MEESWENMEHSLITADFPVMLDYWSLASSTMSTTSTINIYKDFTRYIIVTYCYSMGDCQLLCLMMFHCRTGVLIKGRIQRCNVWFFIPRMFPTGDESKKSKMEFSWNGGTPRAEWFTMHNPNLNFGWFGGTLIKGNHQMAPKPQMFREHWVPTHKNCDV